MVRVIGPPDDHEEVRCENCRVLLSYSVYEITFGDRGEKSINCPDCSYKVVL